jgi:hypothetical protein
VFGESSMCVCSVDVVLNMGDFRGLVCSVWASDVEGGLRWWI